MRRMVDRSAVLYSCSSAVIGMVQSFLLFDRAQEIDDAVERVQEKVWKATHTTMTMLASGWDGGTYSFEDTYPSAQYDISIEVAPTATREQFEAFGEAMICGSADGNVATALNGAPTVDIPILVKVVAK